MSGAKSLIKDLINLWEVKRGGNPALIIKKLTDIYNILEDVYSVSSITEIQTAITNIGTGVGTIFIEAGTYDITETIDIDNCGSLVIYGHGDNTILKAADGVTIFNITCATSCLIKTLMLDITNYTADTQAIIVDEASDHVVRFEDIYILGAGANGIGIELRSDNCLVEKSRIYRAKTGIYINNSEKHSIVDNILFEHANYGIHLNLGDSNVITGNACIQNTLHGIYIYDSDYVIISNNGCSDNLDSGMYFEIANYCTITSNPCVANLKNGIYMTQGNHNTLSNNKLSNNDSNTINAQAGLYINANCDFNTISANSVNDNNNIGAGTSYGVYIANANCNENVVALNNINGNDVNWLNNGTETVLIADDTAYAASWNGDLGTATKNAIYDKINTMVGSIKYHHIIPLFTQDKGNPLIVISSPPAGSGWVDCSEIFVEGYDNIGCAIGSIPAGFTRRYRFMYHGGNDCQGNGTGDDYNQWKITSSSPADIQVAKNIPKKWTGIGHRKISLGDWLTSTDTGDWKLEIQVQESDNVRHEWVWGLAIEVEDYIA